MHQESGRKVSLGPAVAPQLRGGTGKGRAGDKGRGLCLSVSATVRGCIAETHDL